MDNLRNNIKLMREQLKISQLSFALALGNRKEDYYGRIERGEKELYLFDTMIIAHHLGISPILLLYLSGFDVFTLHPEVESFNSSSQYLSDITTNNSIPQERFFNEIKWKSYWGRKSCNKRLFYSIVHAAIRHLRIRSYLNTAQLSHSLNYSKRHYAKIERDARPLTLYQCLTLCDCLNVSITKLMLIGGIYFWFTNSKGEILTRSYCIQRFPHLFNKKITVAC